MADNLTNQDLKAWFQARIRVLQDRVANIDDLIVNGDKYNAQYKGDLAGKVTNYFTNEFWDAHDNLPNINLWTKLNAE